MTSKFDALSTTDQVLDGIDLKGKRVLVTGVSSGLGVETARALVAHGANVVGAARDLEKARQATQAIGSVDGACTLELIELDLASLASVNQSADRLLADGRPFALIVANAGIMAAPFGQTKDGFETHFGTNHLGHFVLVNRIASLIAPGGRVVVLASAGHRFTDVDLIDPNFDKGGYEPFTAYGRSKTANILFAVEFDRRHRDRGVRAVSVHPGAIQTELGRHIGKDTLTQIVKQDNENRAAKGEPLFVYKSIPQGAATSIWAGIVADAAEVGGRYCENCHVAVTSEAVLASDAEGVRPYALDAERAKALWAKSEEMVGQQFP